MIDHWQGGAGTDADVAIRGSLGRLAAGSLVYAAAMSKIGFLLAVPAVVLAGACAQTDATPAAAPVPAGCEPTGYPLTWSPTRTKPILVEATLHGAAELVAGATGTPVLNQPFTPSITGVAAPASWLADLGNSLARETGKPVHTDVPSAEGQSFGVASGPDRTAVVIYTGVDQVSADFEVRCDPAVRGTLHAWSKTVAGGVACAAARRRNGPARFIAARSECSALPDDGLDMRASSDGREGHRS